MIVSYLIKYREQPALFSKRWFIVWVKRGLTFTGLLRILWSAWFCRLRGGKVGALTIIEGTPMRGKLSNLVIGEETFIAQTVEIRLRDQVVIGSRVVINSGVQLLTGSHDLKDPQWRVYSKPIVIEDYAWIATNAIILPGVRIGRGAVVGAGAVVRGNVPPDVIVTGNPAHKSGERCGGEYNYSPVNQCAVYEAWLGKLNEK